MSQSACSMPLDGRVGDDAAGEARGVVHQLPEVLDVARVLADQPGLEVGDHGRGRVVRPARVRLADAVDALVGLDPDEHVVAAVGVDEERLDLG